MLFHNRRKPLSLMFCILSSFAVLVVAISEVSAQSGVNTTGNGGRHTIQGSVFSPSGRRANLVGIKVRLRNISSGELLTFVDTNGNFGFRNLTGGSYYLFVEGTADYDQINEPIYIDDPGSTSLGGSAMMTSSVPRVISVPIYLQAKRTVAEKNRVAVINARIADIPKPALEQAQKAYAALEKNDTKQAIERLNEAVRLYPQFSEAYSELGSLYLKTAELDKAEQALRKTLQLNENNSTAQLNLGIVLLNQRKMYEAEKQLEKAVLADENSAMPHYYLGISLLGLNYPEYAEKEFLKALSLQDDDKSARAHHYLGGIYWEKRDYKKAIEHLELYIKALPKAADAEKARAAIKELQGKIK